MQQDGSRSLHKINTAKKFALDQTLGAVVNTVAFVAFFAALSGKDSIAIQRTVRRVGHLLLTRRFHNTHSAAGHPFAHDGWVEVMACRLIAQLHCRTDAQEDPGWLGGGVVLGNILVAVCCGVKESKCQSPFETCHTHSVTLAETSEHGNAPSCEVVPQGYRCSSKTGGRHVGKNLGSARMVPVFRYSITLHSRSKRVSRLVQEQVSRLQSEPTGAGLTAREQWTCGQRDRRWV